MNIISDSIPKLNQNHRLSRWYAPRLQGDIASNASRHIEKSSTREYFTAATKVAFYLASKYLRPVNGSTCSLKQSWSVILSSFS